MAYIKELKWMNDECEEALLLVTDGNVEIVCFSQPCRYRQGKIVEEILECLDVRKLQKADTEGFSIQRAGEGLGYELRGKLLSARNGIVEVGGIRLHIDETRIPADIGDNRFVTFQTSRIDLW